MLYLVSIVLLCVTQIALEVAYQHSSIHSLQYIQLEL